MGNIDLNSEKILKERKASAMLYLNSKYSTIKKTMTVSTIVAVASLVSSTLGIIMIFQYQELYFFTFIEAVLLVLSAIVSINTSTEVLKIKGYMGRIYHDIDALIEVEEMIIHDNSVEEKMIKEQKRLDELQKNAQERNYELEHPQCPTCGGRNTKRITTLNRAVSIGVVGIASSKIGKTFECLDCKYKW